MFGFNNKVYVFLYGNSLPDEPSGEYALRGLKDHMTHMSEAKSNGTMYLMKDVVGVETPAVDFDESGNEVYGQLYYLNHPKTALELMDALEYSEHLPIEKCVYLRRQLRVTCTKTGKKVRAWVYDLNPASEMVKRGRIEIMDIIPGGDWIKFLKERSQKDTKDASASGSVA